jgi:hypothetical protein
VPRAKNNKPAARDKAVLAIKSEESYGESPNRRTYTIEVYVDWVAILRTLGRRAAENKSGKASLMYGSIIVKAK